MTPCRLCGKILPAPYDPSAIWLCNECRKEFVNASGINKEDLQEAIQGSLDAYRGQDPGGLFRKEGPEAMDQQGDEHEDAGHEGEKTCLTL